MGRSVGAEATGLGSESRLCPALDVPLQENHLILRCFRFLTGKMGPTHGVTARTKSTSVGKMLSTQ